MLRERLIETLGLKAVARAGWVRVGVKEPESVAAHSWGVAWLVLNLCPPHLDRERALALALLHDLAEVRVGDLTPHDPISPEEKRHTETEAFGDLVAPLPRRNEFQSLLQDYVDQTSAEACFVKSCDKLDMALQAGWYEARQDIDLSEFVNSALARLEDSVLARLVGSR